MSMYFIFHYSGHEYVLWQYFFHVFWQFNYTSGALPLRPLGYFLLTICRPPPRSRDLTVGSFWGERGMQIVIQDRARPIIGLAFLLTKYTKNKFVIFLFQFFFVVISYVYIVCTYIMNKSLLFQGRQAEIW